MNVTFDLILNLAWGAVGLAAWVYLITRPGTRGWHQRITVLLAIIALFPCISASDDLAVLRNLQIPTNDISASSGSASSLSILPQMLETLESSQVAASFVLLLTLLACCLVVAYRVLEVSRTEVVLAGRGPPLS